SLKDWSTLSPRAVLATLVIASAMPAAIARAASDTDSSGAVPASAKLDTDNFVAEMSAVGPYKAGAPATVKVSLTTKGVFHINGQYPYRFKTAPAPDGLTYSKAVLERADGQFEEKTAVFTLPFVASHAGTFNVGGIFHMSVCSPTSCVVQKAPLDISVTVQ
ncbi:MAG TPA: hypothetical protein VGL19_04755, partial [Polyangiaceae bacterium]